MKTFTVLVLIVINSLVCFSQTNTLIIKAIDSKGLKDSVVMGYRENATTGIDPDLDESDYYGQPNSGLSIRSIQRTTITKDGYWLFSNSDGLQIPPYSNNVDLKKDFREYAMIEHFIVQVNALNYPVTVKVNYLNFDQVVEYSIYSKDNENDSISGDLRQLVLSDKNDTVVVFNNASENKLIGFHPQVVTGVKDQKFDNQSLSVFPNPVADKLVVEGDFKSKEYYLKLYSVNGELVKNECFNGGVTTYRMDVSSLKSGIYILHLTSDSGKYAEQIIIKK